MVEQVAHNHKVAGSIPAPATNFQQTIGETVRDYVYVDRYYYYFETEEVVNNYFFIQNKINWDKYNSILRVPYFGT